MSQSSNPLQGSTLAPISSGGLGGAVSNLLGGGGPSIQGPPQQQYGQAIGQAGTNAANLLTQGANYSQTAAQINNPYQAQSMAQLQGTEKGLGNLAGQYGQYGNSQALAQAQFQQAQDASIQQALAAQGAARGPGVAGAALAANAGQAQAAGAAALGSGQTQAQQQQFGMAGQAGSYGQAGALQLGEYGLETNTAEQQAQLQSQNQAQQNAMQLGLYGLGQQAQGQQLSGLNSYTSGLLGAQGAQVAGLNASNAMGGQVVSGIAGGLQAGLSQPSAGPAQNTETSTPNTAAYSPQYGF